MTRRPQISVTPTGLAYISGDWRDRDSAHQAENALRTIWADLDRAGLTATLNANAPSTKPELSRCSTRLLGTRNDTPHARTAGGLLLPRRERHLRRL